MAATLIIGATGAVGQSLANRLDTAGESVVLAGRDTDALAELEAKLADAHSVTLDILAEDYEGVLAGIAATHDIKALAYCVGSIDLKPLKAATAEEFMHAYRVNVIGAALAMKAMSRSLAKHHGSAVLFSTVAAQHGFANHAITAAAKGGVEALTRSLAAELAPHVRVNAVALSLSRGRMSESLTGNEKIAEGIAKLHPIPRLGEPDDGAAAAAYLLSEAASWVTGAIMPVDGGRGVLKGKG